MIFSRFFFIPFLVSFYDITEYGCNCNAFALFGVFMTLSVILFLYFS